MKKMILLALAVLSLSLCLGGYALAPNPYVIEPPVPKGYDMPYTITVYLSNQMVVVYNAETGEPHRYCICSSGKGSLTPTGTFTMPSTYTSGWDRWGNIYVRYPTRISGSYYFHSILYSASDKSLNMESWRDLGRKASHGCIRMTPLDAQWINYNCKRGTRIRIVNDRGPGLADIHDQIRAALNKNGHASVQPTLKPTPTPPPPTIQAGSTATSRIKALQESLRGHGFYNGKTNGAFDATTASAWNAYEHARGWAGDSIATTEEQIDLFNDDDTTALDADLYTGVKGPIVRKVEERLKALGFYTGTPAKTYDANTVAAVKKYQLAAGITPANGKLLASQQPQLFSAAAPTPAPLPDLTIGSTGTRVQKLQTRLFSLGFYAGTVTSKYQAATEQAVRAYQAAIGEPETGTASRALEQQIATDDTFVGTARTLRLNAKGIVVRAMEEKLNSLGHLSGETDHIFDARTVAAVKRYQAAHSLPPTGIATPSLLKQLFGEA